jgi:hypothetical protein
MPLTIERLLAIERAFRAGQSPATAAEAAGCAHTTASRHFARFRSRNIPRIEARRRKWPRRGWPRPYDGPDWIGEAIR